MRISALVLAAVAAVAVVAVALVVVLTSGQDDLYPRYDGAEAIETSVEAVVDVPPRWVRKPVAITGTFRPVDGERFVLEGDERSIVVNPEPGTLDGVGVGAGDEVTVIGIVDGFSRFEVSALDRLLDGGQAPALARAPHEVGGPYVSADEIRS